MRGVASLFAVGLLMAVLHRFTASGALEARATLALGFVVFAAYVGGELSRRVHVPRITGYLLVGFAVGPAWLGLVRRDELDALRFIGDAALALIAFAAGAELTLEAVRQGRRALARLATGAMAFPFVTVTLVVLSVTPWFPLTVHRSWGDGLAVALTLGTIAAASSPLIAMAMIRELEPPGPFARALLGVTIVQDVALVLLFALALVVAKAGTSAGALNLAVAGTAVADGVGSLAVGAALGVALGRYLRMAQRDTTLFLVAMAFVAVQVARLAHLEAPLIALAAGCALENVSRPAGERVRRALQRAWLPVQVASFALVGAALRLGVLAELWPWAVLLVGLRAVSLRYGLQWAGRDPAVPPALAQHGWLGLVSQAGMVSGVAQLARRAFPEWGVSLETLIVAMIGVHEVAGPICFHRALVQAGELGEGTHEAAALGERGAAVPARERAS
jgi:Kef-type K+ transport system membrane component KefB